jgi:aminotransferase
MRDLAERIKVIGISRIEESLRILEQKPEIISLGAGEPDFPAPKNVVNAAKKYLEKGYTHYAPLQGKIELLEALEKKLKKENRINASKEEIIVTCGSKEAIFLAVSTLVNPGEEVIIPDPGYIAYKPIVEFLGGKAVSLKLREEDNFEVHPEELKKLINKRTKLIIINSPSNPTGTVLKKKTLEEIADIAIEKNLFILADEAYEKLVYDDAKHISIASLNGMKNYVITTQTFSKTYAMCGLRIGYAVAPENIIKEMKEFKICTTLAAPTAFQLAAVEALKGSKKYVEKMRKEYNRRRKMLVKRLNQIPKISCIKPEGAFYAFPNIGELKMSSEKITQFLLEKAKVIVIPGTEFGKYGEGFVRLSYATAYEKIEEAMNRIEEAIRKL